VIHDAAIAESVPDPRTHRLRTVAYVQGTYFLFTGVWPLVHIDSFQAVTGPKFDLWLVYTVGAVVAVIGLTLLMAAANRRVTTEVMVLAIGSALALATIDVVFVARGVISGIYLADAAAEVVLAAGWALAHVGWRTKVAPPAPQYPHLQALLNRGRSVSPNGKSTL
jgi:hypothetical protein